MTWVLDLLGRTPQSSGPPDIEEIEPLHFTNLSFFEALGEDGSLECSIIPETLGGDARLRLRDLALRPCEVRLSYDGVPVWAGPVWGYQRQGDTLTVNCRGLLGYTRYMQVDGATGDLTFSAVDQHLIAKALIDAWQALDYGNYGLDTSTIASSGTTRTRNYLAAERHVVYERLRELAEVGGFDVWVDPDRTVRVGARGSDRSDDVFLDHRNITDADLQCSVSPQDLASEAWAVTTGDAALTVLRSNTVLRASFGRAGVSDSFDGVVESATLQAHGDRMLADRAGMLFVPGHGLMPVADADVTDFGVGDVVSLSYDFGLGLVETAGRVAEKRVQVSGSGEVSISVAFA